MAKARRNPFARKSSIKGKNQRATARLNAHLETLRKYKELTIAGYMMPDPPIDGGGHKRVRRFTSASEAHKAVTEFTGLRRCAALDFLRK